MATAAHRRRLDFGLRPGWRQRLNHFATAYLAADRADDREAKLAVRRELAGEERLVGCGAGRDVLPLPAEAHDGGCHAEYVVKLPIAHRNPALRGLGQNRREIRTWRASQSCDLVPVVASAADGSWLVMPRGTAVSCEEARTGQFCGWLEAVERDHDSWIDDRDIDRKNAVRLDGEYHLCDYGWAGPDRSRRPNAEHARHRITIHD